MKRYPDVVHDEGETRHEYSEHLWITTGIPGNDQEGSFTNATLQSTGDDPNLEFSVAVHVGVPIEIDTEEKLRDYLRDVFKEAIFATEVRFGVGTLNVVVQLGPAGSGEDD